MSKQGTIIVVDDNKGVLSAVKLLLKNHFEHIVTLPSPITLPAALREENAQVVLLDMNFSSGLNTGNEGLYWLHEIKKIQPSLPVVLFTAYADIDLAVRGIKEGATDFIVKPWDNARLIETLLSACRNSSKNKKRAEIPKTVSSMYWGESNAMKQLRTLIEKVAQTDANILILGENGTGKDLIARALYHHSPRCNQVFVSIDLGSIPEQLFESELFGYEKGAFTDARRDKPGRMEVASGGTLFLDEIGNLSLPMQAKLLTAIEKRQILRLGATRSVPIDVRLISATNMNIHAMVQEGTFRQDLLYRINTIELHIPPLRERGNDILLLADYFLNRYVRKYKKKIGGLTRDAKTKLQSYAWPGNVRELQHAIERAVILSDGSMLKPENFMLHPAPAQQKGEPEELNLSVLEKEAIERALRRADGNITRAAELLGITRFALYRKLDKLGL